MALKCQVYKKACHLNSWNPSWTWSPWRSWWPRGRNFLICSLQYSCFVGICWWNWWLFVWRSCDSRDVFSYNCHWWLAITGDLSQESRSRSRSHSPAIPSFLPGTPRDAGYTGTPRHASEPEPQADQAQGGKNVARVWYVFQRYKCFGCWKCSRFLSASCRCLGDLASPCKVQTFSPDSEPSQAQGFWLGYINLLNLTFWFFDPLFVSVGKFLGESCSKKFQFWEQVRFSITIFYGWWIFSRLWSTSWFWWPRQLWHSQYSKPKTQNFDKVVPSAYRRLYL